MDERQLIMQGLMFGIRVTEHAYGVRRSCRVQATQRIFDTIRQIAEGELTLVDTPGERAADIVDLPTWWRQSLPVILLAARAKERRTAQLLWQECCEGTAERPRPDIGSF